MKILLVLAALIVLIGGGLRLLMRGPWSLRAEYERAVAQGLERATAQPVLTKADVAPLPAAVQRYLRLTGAVGHPRVVNFRARMHGRFRSGPDARWMAFTAQQVNTFDQPTRLFYMRASMLGVPVVGLHRYVGPSATMLVKAAGLVTVADARGPEADQAETVTLFNDMCFFAPATLASPSIRWGENDDHTVHATFTNAGHTIAAVLSFDDRGALTDFVSDDRFMSSPDGRTFTRTRWSTPIAAYRAFGPHLLAASGEARWHPAQGEFAYMEFIIDTVDYNVSSGR